MGLILQGVLLHGAGSFLVALGAAGCWSRMRRGAGLLRTAAAALLITAAMGNLKEVGDLARNPWSLSPADLRADVARDIAANLAGAAAGALAFTALARGLQSRRETRPARKLAGGRGGVLRSGGPLVHAP